MLSDYYKNCTLCPRNCGVDRGKMVGYCGEGTSLKAARAGLHFYEEPHISGTKGSGTVFFTGCSLKCIYCQNCEISEGSRLEEKSLSSVVGFEITVERLADIFLEQQVRGANNINLVTGTHFTPSIAEAIKLARSNGLTIPTLWNSSGYEKPETLMLLEGLIDIWLPDFKTLSPELGRKYMNAPDYPEMAKEALGFMVSENEKSVKKYLSGLKKDGRGNKNESDSGGSGEAVFSDNLMIKGINVRHLVLPGSTKDSMAVIEYLYKTYGDRIYISIMSQYTPLRKLPFEELNRKLTKREYEKVVDFAIDLGISNAFIQEEDVAEASFIPKFDGEGII